MRIARQPLATDFLAEMEQLLFSQAPFHVSAGIDARRHVALNIEAVAAVVFTLGVPEMVEAGAKHVRERGEGANVAPQITAIDRVVAIGLDHHRHRIPAHVGTQTLLNFDIARAALFLVGGDGVDVSCVGRKRPVNAALARMIKQLFKQKMSALWPLALNDG